MVIRVVDLRNQNVTREKRREAGLHMYIYYYINWEPNINTPKLVAEYSAEHHIFVQGNPAP